MLCVEIMPFLNSIQLVKNRYAPLQGNNPISRAGGERKGDGGGARTGYSLENELE